MNLLTDHITQIKEACLANQVKTLFAFGSVTNNRFKAESDVDLVVDIVETDPLIYSDYYFNLKATLEEILDRNVDLLELKAIRNPFLKEEIDQSKILVYAA